MLNINELASVVDSINAMESRMEENGLAPVIEKCIARHNEARAMLKEVMDFIQTYCVKFLEKPNAKGAWKAIDSGSVNPYNCIKRYRLGRQEEDRNFYWADNTIGFTIEKGKVVGVSVADSCHMHPHDNVTEWHHFNTSNYCNQLAPEWDMNSSQVQNITELNVKSLVNSVDNYCARARDAVKLLHVFLQKVSASVQKRLNERNAILDRDDGKTTKVTITVTEG